MNEDKSIEEGLEGREPESLQEDVPEKFLQQQPASSTEQETENMEVHKHPHHVTHKKKWGEYLLEFLMLFLAVFLGFVAENIREHAIEREREKELAVSFYDELKGDSSAIQIAIGN